MNCKCCNKKVNIISAIYHWIKLTICLNIKARKIMKERGVSLKEAMDIINKEYDYEL